MYDLRQDLADARCYRTRWDYLVTGVVTAVFFFAIGVWSTAAAYFNFDGSFPRPKLFALVFGVFWSTAFLGSVWIIVAYFRERLFLGEGAILRQGVLRSSTFEITDVVQVSWRTAPVGGSIVLQTLSEKIKIEFDSFTWDERQEIILFLREIFGEKIQEGWSRFDAEVRGDSSSKKTPSRAWFIATALVLAGFAAGFFYIWLAGYGERYLFLGIINTLVAIWPLWRLRFAKNDQAN